MKKLFKRKENGDIALISIFACLLILTILALILEFGLLYFQSARLQNAVDSATIAVAHNLTAEDNSIKSTVESYMKENGVDLTKKGTGTITPAGKLKTKIVYGDNEAIVVIDKKGLVTEEAAANDDGTYITSGYLKLTVAIDCKEYWKTSDNMVAKTGYAKCDMQYNEMPEALKYTIFGNSTETTTDYRDMTVGINGRTNNTQSMANVFTNLINGINQQFVQKIIERLGGNANYNELFNQHLSYAMINGDVHSNSDISIGVNALQASRSKDRDYTGSNSECICQSLCKSDSVNEYCTVCQGDYRKCNGDEQTDDDYNQVHFTAVNNIDFSAGKIINNTLVGSFNNWLGTNNDNNTRVYVRNYQYIEQTQVAIYIIDRLNFDEITSTESLRNKYTEAATKYMEDSITLPDSQRAAVLAQAENLEYKGANKYELKNQKSITYAATNAMANQVMTEVQGGKTLTQFLQDVIDAGYDSTGDDTTWTKYDGTKPDVENSVITFTKKDSDQTAELYVTGAENTNRNLVNMKKITGSITSESEAAYRFAIAKTFRQKASYIQVPNLKPYFIRAINRSVKNATTSKSSDSSDIETSDATSVKDAVKKSQTKLEKVINSKDTLATVENKDGTFTKGAADSTNDAGEVADGDADTYVDNSYKSSEVLTSQKTSPLLKYRLTSTDSSGNSTDYNSYTLTKYKSSSANHTTFNGVNLYDSNGNLNTAKNVVSDYNDKNGNKYGKNAVEKFNKTDVKVDDDSDDASVHDYENHYADDAVAKKKHYIENTLMLSSDSKFTDAAPDEDEVFLMKKGTKKEYLDGKISNIKEITKEISSQELSVPADLRVEPVESRYKTLIEESLADLGYNIEASTGITVSENQTSISKNYIKPDGTSVNESYAYEDLLPGQDSVVKKPVSEILEETRNDFAISPDDIQAKVTAKYNELYALKKSTTGWATINGKINNVGSDYSEGDNWEWYLSDKTVYNGNIDNPWRSVAKYYGISLKSGCSAVVNGDLKADDSKGSAKSRIGTTDSTKETYLYVTGNININRGDLNIGDNTTVICDGNLHVFDDKWFTIGKNSKVIVGGNIEIQDGKIEIGENSVLVSKSHIFFEEADIATTAQVYAGGDIYKRSGSGDFNIGGKIYSTRALYFNSGSGNINIKDGARIYLGRDISTEGNGDINIGKNAIVVANRPVEWAEGSETGVVRATNGHTISMDTGSVLVTLPNAPKDNAKYNTYHTIDASSYNCKEGSTIVTDMIKAGNSNNTAWLANVICDKINTNTLVFTNNSHVFATNGINIQNSKTVEMNPGTKLLLGMNDSGVSVSGNSSFKLSDSYYADSNTNKVFAIGATGTITGLASNDYTLYNGCYLSAPGLQIGNLTIKQGGGFCVPKDKSVTVGNITIEDGSSTYIGILTASDLTVSSDVKIQKIASADSVTVNSGKLLVESSCKAQSVTNKSELFVTTDLEVGSSLENSGKILVGVAPTDSNPGSTGSLKCSSITVNNTNKIQVYGNASVGVLNNKYNTAQSRGSTVYVKDTFTLTTLNNEKGSKVICGGNLTADTLVNTADVQVENIIVNSSLTNNANANIKANNSFTSYGTANNSGFIEIDGNSQFGSVTNGSKLKINGSAQFTGTVTNTGKLQVTSYGATFSEVVNNGELAVAGAITSTGKVTNSDFICSNSSAKFNSLENSGVVSVEYLVVPNGSVSNIVNKENGVIEMYGNVGSSASSVTTFDNKGEVVSNREISVYESLTNTGKFESYGIRADNITNTGKIYSQGAVEVRGTINNNSNGKTGEDNSIIYVGSSSSCNLEADTVNNYANIFVDGGSVNVSTMLSCKENSSLYVNKGDITTNHIEFYENCSFKYNHNLTINGYLVNRANLTLTGINAERIQNYGNLYVESGKDFSVRYFMNMSGANFALDGGGDFIVENHRDSISILNEGNMYINGNVYAYASLHTLGGEIYVNGELDVANSLSYNSSAVYMDGYSQLYVYGDVPTNSYGNGVTIAQNSDASAKKAIYSVYGKGSGIIYSGSINSNQVGSKLYFGTNVNVTPYNNTQTVKGAMYVYGEYTCYKEMNFYIQDAGLLYIAGDVYAPYTDVYVSNAGLYCYGEKVLFRNVNGNASMIYFLNIKSADTYPVVNKVTISNVSLLYTPKGVTIPDSKLSVSDDSTYLYDPSSVWPISSLNFPTENSTVVTTGNVRVSSTLQIEENQTLCVGGNLYIGTFGSIVVYGHLYVMGKIFYANTELSDRYNGYTKSSFEELIDIAGPKADVFIGKTKSGVLKLQNYLNAYGSQQIYFDNDLLINGNLSNSGTSKAGVSGGNLVPNRGESIITEGTSKVCVSGNVYSNGYTNNTGNAVYIGKGTSFSCGGTFYADSCLFNYGKFFVKGEYINYKKADGSEATNSRKWATNQNDESKNYLGISVKNGDSDNHDASIYIGGVDKNGNLSETTVIFEGYIQNYGKINVMQPVYIKGYKVTCTLWMRTIGENKEAVYATRTEDDGSGAKYENAPRTSILAEECSRANFGNNVAMLGGYITFNRPDSIGNADKCPIFSAEGDATYGMCIINGGIFYAKGQVGYTGRAGHTLDTRALGLERDEYSDYYIHHLEIFYRNSSNLEGDKKGSYSIVNGYVFNGSRNGSDCAMNTNALFYAGGSLQVGTSEDADANNIGGSVQNYGNMYIDGSLTVYSNKEYAISYIAISSQVGSKTVIAGDCWSSGGTVTMRNSLLMCDGDFMSKRCSRIGASEQVNSNDDLNSSSYLYVGGNMVTSTLGTGGSGDLAGNIGGSEDGNSISTWNYLDIFSNASIYVGGAFFTNSIFSPRKNVTLIVDGKDKGKVNTKTNFITWLQTVANNVTLSLNGYDYDDFKFIVNNRFDVNQTLKEGRTKTMLNRFYIHGSAFLNGRARISDMTKFYVYGDLVNRTDLVSKITAFEIGRALNTSDDGDTWASKGTFVDEDDEPRFVRNDSGNLIQNPDYDYNYANACYVYVQGNLDLDRKISIYPGTTIKTGKDYSPYGAVKLMHDTSIYSGGKIYTHRYIDVGQYSKLFARENITAWNYICVREHGILYSGSDVKCGTSFEAKTSSTIYSCGSIKATLSNIKIRDNTTVFCSGNMTALSYIELGKHDENYKDTLRQATPSSDDNVCTCTGKCTESDYDGDCPVCKNDYTKCTAPAECICTTLCTADSKNADCPVCNTDSGWSNCEAQNPDTVDPETTCTCTIECNSQDDANNNTECAICKKNYENCSFKSNETVLENDLTKDPTDDADGGEFYIGKKLASFTSYIRQYGFSSTVVGEYVFANKYLTLRSNSDMWVLPEAYNNSTYKHVDKTFESDGSILGNIVKFFKETAYNIKDKLSFKNGSVYTMGDLTLNKNASLMGTYNMYAFGKSTLFHDSLVYFGHDVKFYGPSLDLIDGIKNGSYTGFKAAGDVYTTLRCTNKEKHPNGYTIYTKNYDSSKTYKCDKCGATLSSSTVKENVTCPVTIYANNDITIATSTDMSMCYAVACNGDVTISDPYGSCNYDDRNLYQLPNAIASYNGNISYSTMYGKIAALFYAPNNNVHLDGYYQEIWGSIIGDTVSVDTFYINLHRFSNWRTMDLQIAESGSVYLISEEEYEKQVNNVDESYLHTGNTQDETDGGAALFFDRDLLNGSTTGQGTETTN